MNVTTVALANRKHYAHPENRRTLCGRTGGRDTVGISDCGRCTQILLGVDTSHRTK